MYIDAQEEFWNVLDSKVFERVGIVVGNVV